MNTRKIIASPTHSPLPYRQLDWCAYYHGEEEAGNYGYGATEEEAIADFVENCAEDHDARLNRDWQAKAHERIEYEDPYGYSRGRRW